MLEWMEKMIEDLKEKDYWEKYHNHSPLAKFVIDLCLKEAELGELQVTEEDVIYDSKTNITLALLWIFYHIKKDGFRFDFNNDSMSFIDDWTIIDISAAYSMAYCKKASGSTQDYVSSLNDLILSELGPDLLYQLNMISFLVLGKPIVDNQEKSLLKCTMLSIHKLVHRCRRSNIEPMVYDHYTNILNNIIYSFGDITSPYSEKLHKIEDMLYTIGSKTVGMPFYEYLPKFTMIYLYVLLNNFAAKLDNELVYIPLITGDIKKIEDSVLEEIRENLSKPFKVYLMQK